MNKQNLECEDITTDTKKKSIAEISQDITKKWVRQCPRCNKNIYYKTIKNYNYFCNKNTVCESCKEKDRTKNLLYKKICSGCNKELIYKSKKGFKKSSLKNSTCQSCSIKKSHKKRGHLSKEDKLNKKIYCQNCGKERKYYGKYHNRICKSCYAKMNYPNKKEILKKSLDHRKLNYKPKKYTRICPQCKKELKHTSLHYVNKSKNKLCKSCDAINDFLSSSNGLFKHFHNYNKIGCEIINKYGLENGYNFQHAINGGEIHLKEINCYPDGYDKEKNVIIECCEPFHYRKGKLTQKDIKRINKIKQLLKCKIIIIKYDGKSTEIEKITILDYNDKEYLEEIKKTNLISNEL